MEIWLIAFLLIAPQTFVCRAELPNLTVDRIGDDKEFKVGEVLGRGAFGEVREGTNEKTGESVAIKFEMTKARKVTLPEENQNYEQVGRHRGIPRIYYFGRTTDGEYNVLVMEKLGTALDKLQKMQEDGLFSAKTTLMIAIQMLYRLESIHKKGMVHRDLKPQNMAIGKNPKLVYLFDFGLSKKYRDDNGDHIKLGNPVPRGSGTPRYMSYHAHRYREQSRRDDLESLGFVLTSMMKKELPWDKYRGLRPEEMQGRMYRKKARGDTIRRLCDGLPPVFIDYFRYVRNIKFDTDPDYKKLRKAFRKELTNMNEKNDKMYDWRVKKETSMKMMNAKKVDTPQKKSRSKAKNIVMARGMVASDDEDKDYDADDEKEKKNEDDEKEKKNEDDEKEKNKDNDKNGDEDNVVEEDDDNNVDDNNKDNKADGDADDEDGDADVDEDE